MTGGSPEFSNGERTPLRSRTEPDGSTVARPLLAIHGHDRPPADRASARRRVIVSGKPTTIIEALSVALNTLEDLEVVGLASNADCLFRLVESRRPDALVVYAPHMGPEIVESTGRLKGLGSRVRVLLLTERPTLSLLAHAAAVGVAACLPLDTGLQDLIGAIRADTTEMMLIGVSALTSADLTPDGGATVAKPAMLTPRELEVLGLLADGVSPAAIAVRLVVSIYTARGHVKNVLRKLGAHSQLEAVAIATRLGLLPGPASPTAGPEPPERSGGATAQRTGTDP